MIPTAQKRQIVQAIRREMKGSNLTQNGWADKHSFGRSSMTNILHEKNWDKVGERTWNRLAAKMQHLLGVAEMYPTQNSQQIIKACEDARANNRVVSIVGHTGAGKTITLKQWASDNGAHYLVCRSTFGLKDLVIQIAEVMGIRAKGGRVIDIEQAIIDELTHRPNSLLILDSVSKLRKDAALQFIGDLCEATEQKTGIVLAGTEFFDDYMMKMVQRNKRGFREFNRRIYAWVRLPSFNSKAVQREAREICIQRGIYIEEQIKYLLKASTCFGSLSNGIDKMIKSNRKTAANN